MLHKKLLEYFNLYLWSYIMILLLLEERFYISAYDYNRYHLFFYFTCAIFLWVIIFHKPYDEMDKNRITELYNKNSNLQLRYKYYLDMNCNLQHLYVKDYITNRYYEVCYDLCIPKGSSEIKVKEFIKDNISVMKLYFTMIYSKNKRIYEANSFSYTNYRIISLCMIIFIYLILTLI